MTAVLDYDGSPQGILLPPSEIVQKINLAYYRAHTELPEDLDDFVGWFDDATNQDNRNLCIQQATKQNNAQRVALVEYIRQLGRLIETRMLDRPTVLTPLMSGSDNIYEILRLMFWRRRVFLS